MNVSRRRRQMVRILWRGFTKSCQPSDPPEKRGGYSYIQSLSSRNGGPSDHPIVTCQPSDLTGVAQGLCLREKSGNSEKHQNIEASEFGKLGISWTRDHKIHHGNLDELRSIHILGQVAGTRSHRYIGGS
jgi:hypothetical protein